MNEKKRVLLSMSGGIDSTVAAILLKRQGFELVGITYNTWDNSHEDKGNDNQSSINEAKQIAENMGITHHFIDIRSQFKDNVITNFINEYLAGRTPNPCVVCNDKIKWGEIAKIADQLNCQYLATGHYAQIETIDSKYFLKKGVDEHKDQTYFLWKISQDILKRTIFPLGKLTKSEVRKIALEEGLKSLSEKKESQEICFIPNNDYRVFLQKNVPEYEKICQEGYFIDTQGKILGKHKGYPNYTIGQRKGLNIALGRPMFVKNINATKNTVELADREELLRDYLIARDIMLIDDSFADGKTIIDAKIRYKTPSMKATVEIIGNEAKVTFQEKAWAITSGQSVVFYKNNLVVGGGIIK